MKNRADSRFDITGLDEVLRKKFPLEVTRRKERNLYEEVPVSKLQGILALNYYITVIGRIGLEEITCHPSQKT